jgi:hypothetical protein
MQHVLKVFLFCPSEQSCCVFLVFLSLNYTESAKIVILPLIWINILEMVFFHFEVYRLQIYIWMDIDQFLLQDNIAELSALAGKHTGKGSFNKEIPASSPIIDQPPSSMVLAFCSIFHQHSNFATMLVVFFCFGTGDVYISLHLPLAHFRVFMDFLFLTTT